MANDCWICKNKTIFYIWSTSRNFPRRALINYTNKMSKFDKNKVFVEGVPVCFICNEKLKKYENSSSV